MKQSMSLRQQVKDLSCELFNDIEHGECLYDKDMFEEFISNLEKMKQLATQYYKQNQEEE